jgi:hypothetical protein
MTPLAWQLESDSATQLLDVAQVSVRQPSHQTISVTKASSNLISIAGGSRFEWLEDALGGMIEQDGAAREGAFRLMARLSKPVSDVVWTKTIPRFDRF